MDEDSTGRSNLYVRWDTLGTWQEPQHPDCSRSDDDIEASQATRHPLYHHNHVHFLKLQHHLHSDEVNVHWGFGPQPPELQRNVAHEQSDDIGPQLGHSETDWRKTGRLVPL